jgi:hypothetical protein
MSFTGNPNETASNISNTSPYQITQDQIDSVQLATVNNANDIVINSGLLADNSAAIDVASVLILDNSNNITANTASIATNTTALTDITNDLTSDKTTIENRLTVKAYHGWDTPVTKSAQIVLTNEATKNGMMYDTMVWSGAENMLASQSHILLSQWGTTAIVNTRTGATEDSTAICLCGLHLTEDRGLLISLKGDNQSKYCGSAANQFAFQCGSVYCQSELLLYPPGKTYINVYDTIFDIIAVNTTQTGDITAVDDRVTTTESNISINEANIGLIQGDITAIETVNTTQTGDISTNASAITAIQFHSNR